MNLIEKRKAYEAKAAEFNALREKADKSKDDLAKLKELTTEVISLKGEVETLAEADNLGAQIKAASGVSVQLDQDPKSEKAQVTDKGIEFESSALTEKQFKATRDPEYAKTVRKFIRGKGNWDSLDSMERKSLSEGLDDDGGFLAPVEMLNRMLERKAAPTRLSNLVTNVNCSGRALTVPFVNYNGSDNAIYPTGVRATLTGEIPSSSTAHLVTDQQFGQKTINIETWMLSQVLTNDLIEDAAYDVLGHSAAKFAETIDLLTDNEILNGKSTGTRGFEGIITNVDGTEGVVSVNSTVNDSFAAIDLIGLPFDLPEQYLEGAVYIMNRASTGKTIAQMLDGANRPIWQRGGTVAGIEGIAPDVLNGYPVIWSAFMPNKADAVKSILFGNPRGYMVARRAALSIRILTEVSALSNSVTLLGRVRMGGDMLEPWQMKALKSI